MLMAKTDVERNMFQEQQNVKVADAMRLEKEQTDTLSDDEIVELVEKTIRDNPADYPLLTKYYLNAEYFLMEGKSRDAADLKKRAGRRV